MRRLQGYIWLVLLLLCSCSQQEKMQALMEQNLEDDRQEIVFQTDSIALQLIDYFTQHGTARDQMRAYYLLGRAYDCKNNPVLALRFYHEAIDKADTTAANTDYETLSRAYAHSSKLFEGCFDKRPSLALKYAKKALRYAKQADSEPMERICRCLVGNAFCGLGEWDSLRVYYPEFYNRLFRWWEKQPADSFWYSNTFKPSTPITSNKWEEVKVWYYIPATSIPEEAKKSNHYSVGGGFSHALEKPTDEDSILALSNILSYVDMRLHAQASTNRHNTYLIIILLLLTLLLLAGYLLYRMKRDKARRLIQELNTQYNIDLANYQLIMSEMETLRQKSNLSEQQMAEKQRQLDELQEKLKGQQDDKQHPSVWNVSDNILTSAFLKTLHKKASIGRKADRSDIHQLKAFAHDVVPSFMSALSALDATLDDDNLVVCILTKFRFLPSELAVLLDKSPQVITNRKARLLKRLFKKEGGTRHFDQQIHTLGANV